MLWFHSGVSSLWPVGCVRPRMAVNVAQHKIINLLKTFFSGHQFSLMFLYLMCNPRQLFFQCGPEMPKGWTPIHLLIYLEGVHSCSYTTLSTFPSVFCFLPPRLCLKQLFSIVVSLWHCKRYRWLALFPGILILMVWCNTPALVFFKSTLDHCNA